MNQKKIWPGMAIMALVFGMMVIGCPTEPESRYTVWTDVISSSEFANIFTNVTLNDGYYIKIELTNAEFNSMSLTNEGKHNWTESEIKNWFIGRGFGNTEATRETAWLMTINHGFLASRSGSVVYMLLK